MPIDPVRIALVVALLLAFHSGAPTPSHFGVFIALGALLALSTRRPVIAAAIVVLFVGGMVIRFAASGHVGSDVLWVTEAAIGRFLEGHNPYGYGYPVSDPPGAPFPYGPVAILLYLPFHHAPAVLEFLSAMVVAAILGLQGRLVGLAVYAIAPILVAASVDGSNDTTLGLLILVAFMTAKRQPALGAFILACAAAFKLSALAFVPVFLAMAGGRVAVAFVAGSLLAWAPVLTVWGIPSFVESASRSNGLSKAVIWSLGTIAKALTGGRVDVLDNLRFVFGGIVAVVGLRRRTSLDGVILAGCAVYLVTLYGGNWATYAYLAGIAPIVCWRLDDWLGFQSRSLLDHLRELRRAPANAPEPALA